MTNRSLQILKTIFWLFTLSIIKTSTAQESSLTIDISPLANVNIRQLAASCERLRKASEIFSKTTINMRDSAGRPLSMQLNGHDLTFEYSDPSIQRPTAIIAAGRRIPLTPSSEPAAIDKKKLAARLAAYKLIKHACQTQSAESKPTEAASFDRVSENVVMGPGGGGGSRGDYDDPYYREPKFWTDAWEPDYRDAINLSVNSWLSQRPPKPCVETCNNIVDVTSDGIGLVCGAISFWNPIVGFSCAAGNYVGKYAGKAICEYRCPPQ